MTIGDGLATIALFYFVVNFMNLVVWKLNSSKDINSRIDAIESKLRDLDLM